MTTPAPQRPTEAAVSARKTTCLEPTWDGPYRMRCSTGAKGVCAYHGPHQPHPDDGKPCKPNPHDGYCHEHGVYLDPYATKDQP